MLSRGGLSDQEPPDPPLRIPLAHFQECSGQQTRWHQPGLGESPTGFCERIVELGEAQQDWAPGSVNVENLVLSVHTA